MRELKQHLKDFKWFIFKPVFIFFCKINYGPAVYVCIMQIELGEFRELSFERQGILKSLYYCNMSFQEYIDYKENYYQGIANNFLMPECVWVYPSEGIFDNNETLIKGLKLMFPIKGKRTFYLNGYKTFYTVVDSKLHVYGMETIYTVNEVGGVLILIK